jgi:hypothetical protein
MLTSLTVSSWPILLKTRFSASHFFSRTRRQSRPGLEFWAVVYWPVFFSLGVIVFIPFSLLSRCCTWFR